MAVHTFIVSDESVLNDYGFRVMTKGIKLVQYKRNSIVLWYHKRPNRYTGNNDDVLPIGKAVKLYMEDGKLMADIEFDQNDEFAKKIEQKVEGGFIKMCSPGLNPITISDNPKYLLEGQTRATLVESELLEISIVDIGSNKNALRLYDSEMQVINLSSGQDNGVVPLIKKETETIKTSNMKNIAILLGLNPEASEEVIIAALKPQIELASQASGYKTKMDLLEGQVNAQKDAEIVALVSAHIDKKFTADKKEIFITLGKTSGIETLRSTFEAMTDITGKPTNITGKSEEGKKEDDEIKDFKALASKGVKFLEEYKKDHRDDYIKLYKAEYGVDPNFNYED